MYIAQVIQLLAASFDFKNNNNNNNNNNNKHCTPLLHPTKLCYQNTTTSSFKSWCYTKTPNFLVRTVLADYTS